MKAIAALALALVALAAHGQAKPDQAAEMKAAFDAAQGVMQAGPSDVKLAAQATLHLPTQFVFVQQKETLRLLRAMGNRPSPDTLGMIFPNDPGVKWFMVVRYVNSGYIKDDDAKEWKADDLLANIREGTEAANEERRSRGIPEMQIAGWVEKPYYDEKTHRLVWSLSSTQKGAPAGEEHGVNYNTYLLGREGYMSMNLVTGLKGVEALKPTARELLAALEFDAGKGYTEFNSSTDRVAEYGLAALIGGVAAKKLGLFAVIAAFFAKFIKVIVLGAAALGAAFMKFFRRGNAGDAPTPPA